MYEAVELEKPVGRMHFNYLLRCLLSPFITSLYLIEVGLPAEREHRRTTIVAQKVEGLPACLAHLLVKVVVSGLPKLDHYHRSCSNNHVIDEHAPVVMDVLSKQ